MAILDLWEDRPDTATLGLPKLTALLRERHLDWQVAEKRLRRVRRELLDQLHEPEEVEGFNVVRGPEANIYSAPGVAQTMHIDEDGNEYTMFPAFGAYAMTGRKFRKGRGEWVPIN